MANDKFAMLVGMKKKKKLAQGGVVAKEEQAAVKEAPKAEAVEAAPAKAKPKLQPLKEAPLPTSSTFKVSKADPFAAALKEKYDDKEEMAAEEAAPIEQPKDLIEEKPKAMAEGGPVEDEDEIEHAASVAAAIMARRKMALGGPVTEEGEDLHETNLEAGEMDEDYDLPDVEQPEDSNLIEPEHDEENAHDMIAAIRRKMRKSPISK